MSVSLKIQKLENSQNLPLPKYATEGSAGIDLLAAIDGEITIAPMSRSIVPTGIAIALQQGHEAQIRPRSGLAAKNGITVLNTPGTIDSDYRGEIKVILANLSNETFVITRGMRVAQMVIARYEHVTLQEVDSLDETVRGSGGFGSTGVK